LSQNNERDATGTIKISGAVEANVPPSLISKHDAERQEDKADNDKRFWVEVATLVTVGLYTAVAFVQGCFMYTANTTTREALTSVQRAFVYPITTATQQQGMDGKLAGFFIRIGWANSGTTPTKDLTSHFSEKTYSGGLPKNFDFPDLWSNGVEKVNRPFVLSPKGEVFTQQQMFMSNADNALEKAAVLPNSEKLYLWGWAKYRDVFKDTPRHLTEYCYEVTPITQPPVKNVPNGLIGIQFDQCSRHSCQDDECEDYKEQISKD